MTRISTKRTEGKAAGMRSKHAPHGRKQAIKRQTHKENRRREREFVREVEKAYKAGGQIPEDPHPTAGGYYAT